MPTKANWNLCVYALACGIATSSQAQQRPAVMIDISTCIELPSRSERNACYEALAEEARSHRAEPIAESPATAAVEAAPTAEASPTAEPAPAAAPVTTPAQQSADSAVASFGTTTPAEAASVVDGAEGQSELHDRIVDLSEREPGRWLITLASGQVWYQTNSGRIRLRKDMEVRIYPSPLGGSFRLAGREGSTGFVQVARVK